MSISFGKFVNENQIEKLYKIGLRFYQVKKKFFYFIKNPFTYCRYF